MVAVSVVTYVGDLSFFGMKEVLLINKLFAVGNEAIYVNASSVRTVKSAVSLFDVDGFEIAVDSPVKAAVFKSFEIIVLVGLGILVIWDKRLVFALSFVVDIRNGSVSGCVDLSGTALVSESVVAVDSFVGFGKEGEIGIV